MSRPRAPDLIKEWKLGVPATLAGRIEYVLHDRLTNKPIYGARNRLVAALLEYWLATQSGTPEDSRPHIPSLDELRLS